MIQPALPPLTASSSSSNTTASGGSSSPEFADVLNKSIESTSTKDAPRSEDKGAAPADETHAEAEIVDTKAAEKSPSKEAPVNSDEVPSSEETVVEGAAIDQPAFVVPTTETSVAQPSTAAVPATAAPLPLVETATTAAPTVPQVPAQPATEATVAISHLPNNAATTPLTPESVKPIDVVVTDPLPTSSTSPQIKIDPRLAVDPKLATEATTVATAAVDTAVPVATDSKDLPADLPATASTPTPTPSSTTAATTTSTSAPAVAVQTAAETAINAAVAESVGIKTDDGAKAVKTATTAIDSAAAKSALDILGNVEKFATTAAAVGTKTLTDTHSPEPYRQIINIVHPLRGRDGDYNLTLALNPERLGRVEVQVSIQNGNVNMSMNADNPQARQLLRDSMNELRTALTQSGLTAGSLDVGTRDPGQQQGNGQMRDGSHHGQQAGRELDDATFFSRLAQAATTSTSTSDGPLDVRI